MKQRHWEMPDGFKPKILPCLRAQQKTEDSILKIGRIKATTNKHNCQIIAVSPSSTLDWRIFSQTAQSTTFSWGFFFCLRRGGGNMRSINMHKYCLFMHLLGVKVISYSSNFHSVGLLLSDVALYLALIEWYTAQSGRRNQKAELISWTLIFKLLVTVHQSWQIIRLNMFMDP